MTNSIKERLKIISEKLNYFPRWSVISFTALFLVFSWIYNYHEIFDFGPRSIHQWRQADCLSITQNYYKLDNPFLEPSIHNLGRDGTGKTISEFPILYYSIGQLWKIFGQSEYLFRVLNTLIFFLALIALLRMLESQLKSSFFAIWIVLLLFTSPTIIYYANNFLMDVPALSFAFISLYFYFRWRLSEKPILYFFFLLFALLAGLLKASALLSFLALSGIIFFELLHSLLRERTLKKGLLLRISGNIIVIILVFVWYSYANHYNSTHNSGNFLIGVLPIWEMSETSIRETLFAIKDHIKWDYLRAETFFLSVLTAIVGLLYIRTNAHLRQFLFFMMAGVISFCILFFGALKDHDYYTVNLFVILPFIFLVGFKLINQKYPGFSSSLLFKVILLAFLIHNLDFARRRMEGRYNPNERKTDDFSPLMIHFETIESYLDSLGVGTNDKMISLSDESINVSLYLMNRRGWTNYNVDSLPENISKFKGLGARYILCHDTKPFMDKGFANYFTEKKGEYHGVSIYSLSEN
jgi:hypothetical protein